MSIVQGAGWMNATAALFQTRVTVVNYLSGTWQQIVKPDSRRWWIEFAPAGASTFIFLPVPGESPQSGTWNPSSQAPLAYKWWDCPSVVTGPWWMNGGAAESVRVTECLYIGP